jgi:transcriptional regulator with XRE-family HTH domain
MNDAPIRSVREVGALIRAAREERAWSQERLTYEANVVRRRRDATAPLLSVRWFNRVEAAHVTRIDLETLADVATALGLSPATLLLRGTPLDHIAAILRDAGVTPERVAAACAAIAPALPPAMPPSAPHPSRRANLRGRSGGARRPPLRE